ncbi:hypothetical protein ACFFWC_08860 [Plantactinospora siamensis]|uniref:Uncharacterized protein n=1 Tax=Plantactinospora siamensis TaxID=555372 RepID=A0ABV6P4C9_9ACTN
MGSSDWCYLVPYGPDLEQVLATLRQRVFDEHDYYFDDDDDDREETAGDAGRWPATMAELFEKESVQYEGTHSVLDIFHVIGSGEEDAYGTLRPLTPQEQVDLFGRPRLTRQTFEGAYARRHEGPLGSFGQRWSGHSVVLHDGEGRPTEIAIWGFSGD